MILSRNNNFRSDYVSLLILLVMMLLPLESWAAENIFRLEADQKNVYVKRNSSTITFQLMEGNGAADSSKIKLLEAGWWLHPFVSREMRDKQPLPKYRKLPLSTKLEVNSPVNGSAVVILRFEKENKIYTVQNISYIRADGKDEKEFLAYPGDKEPLGPVFAYPKERMPNNGGINACYLGITTGSKVVKGYDEKILLENKVTTNEKNIFSYLPNEIDRMELESDGRRYFRHLVVSEQVNDKEYISTLSAMGMRRRSKYIEINQGVMLAIVSGLIFGVGCYYYIRRRLQHVSD